MLTLRALSRELIFYKNFWSLEVVSRYRDPQLQVPKNSINLQNLGRNVYDYHRFETYLIFKTWLNKTNKT